MDLIWFVFESRNLVEPYYNRDTSLHKPGAIPNSSRIISPITSNRHKYELKQRIWPKKTVESWFANHSSDGRILFFHIVYRWKFCFRTSSSLQFSRYTLQSWWYQWERRSTSKITKSSFISASKYSYSTPAIIFKHSSWESSIKTWSWGSSWNVRKVDKIKCP